MTSLSLSSPLHSLPSSTRIFLCNRTIPAASGLPPSLGHTCTCAYALAHTVVRVLLYPVTALLGPFVQDAIAATVRVGQEESSGLLLPALTNSCESRALEYEADNVALRLLAGAGMDPRAALAFWEHRLAADAQDDAPHPREVHAHSSARAQRLTQTHPPDRERVAAIRTELHRWMVRRP